jgi:PAS domain-containing protein
LLQEPFFADAGGILCCHIYYGRHPVASIYASTPQYSAAGHGDYTYEFDEIHHIELAGIAHRFKEMANGIRARERMLPVINRELQDEIAERERAEQIIRQSEAQSRAIFDALPDMVFQIDQRGIFLDCQGAKTDLYLAPQAFLGKKIAAVLPGDAADLILQKKTQALATGRSLCQKAVFDGESRPGH